MKKVLQDQGMHLWILFIHSEYESYYVSENYFMDLKNSRRYDEPLYWCHQLFYSNRKPIV
jgi:hypothetical protein